MKWLLLIHAGYLVVSLSPAPLFYIFTAYNKLRTPALTTVAFGVVNSLLAIVLAARRDSAFTELRWPVRRL